MAPVAGSVYTYAYTTLGEIFAWIIGWDIILEYAMGCSTVASVWGNYLNKLLGAMGLWTIPETLCTNPFSDIEGSTAHAIINLPAIFIMVLVTCVLVLGIRESARTNALLVMIKITVVFFVIIAGLAYVKPANWNSIPVTRRVLPQERVMLGEIKKHLDQEYKGKNISRAELDHQAQNLQKMLTARYRMEWAAEEVERLQKIGKLSPEKAQKVMDETQAQYGPDLPVKAADREVVEKLLPKVQAAGKEKANQQWGILGYFGLDRWLLPLMMLPVRRLPLMVFQD